MVGYIVLGMLLITTVLSFLVKNIKPKDCNCGKNKVK